MNTRPMTKILISTLIVSVALTGCASLNGSGSSASGESSECNPALAAGVGAVIGGLIAGKKKTAGGAVIGGALGAFACMAVNYHAEQVKTAKQVQDEYKSAHSGQLPEATKLVKYDAGFKPAVVRGGQKTQSASYIEVVQGKDNANPSIEEEMTLYKPDGDVIKTVKKPVSNTTSAGAFKGGFTIPMPEGVPEGVYPVKTALYLDGKKVADRDAKLQVVMQGGTQAVTIALVR